MTSWVGYLQVGSRPDEEITYLGSKRQVQKDARNSGAPTCGRWLTEAKEETRTALKAKLFDSVPVAVAHQIHARSTHWSAAPVWDIPCVIYVTVCAQSMRV